jgi:hypothetical protein
MGRIGRRVLVRRNRDMSAVDEVQHKEGGDRLDDVRHTQKRKALTLSQSF